MWCPSGTLPGSGCTGSNTFGGAGGLLSLLQSDPTTYSGAGTIYIEYNYNPSTALDTSSVKADANGVVIDGNNLQGHAVRSIKRQPH